MKTMHKSHNIYDWLFDFIEKYFYLFLLPIVLFAVFNLFYCLKDTPIYSWDEARHGISAYEMVKSGQYVINTYGYKPDYWNLKPPLSFWAIALGYRIAGFNALGLRLFSVLAALSTILLITLFASKRYGRISGIISALVLTVSPKYILIHSARTGDSDSLFVFFFTLSMVSMLLIDRSIKFFYLAGFGFSLAFLTKSWHAVTIMIIGGMYMLLSGRLFRLRLRECALFILSSFSLILLWGIIRYSRDGISFFRDMLQYDLLTRSSTTLEGHVGDVWYYFDTLRSYYTIWLFFLGACILMYILSYGKGLIKINSSERNQILGITLWILVPLLLFTKAQTKIGWYILPLYPAVSLAIGAMCGVFTRGPRRHPLFQIIVILFMIKAIHKYQPEIYRHIVMFKNDPKRVSFYNIDITKDIRGLRAYADYRGVKINVGPKSEFKNWEQSDMLSAELYWDLKPMEGGLNEFLADKSSDSILITIKDNDISEIIKKYNLKIIGEGHRSYFLSK